MNQTFSFPQATATVRGGNDAPELIGEVKFYQKRSCVLIEATVKGLPLSDTGFFGFHIHEGDKCSGDDFSDTGNHYNPEAEPHPSHAGDLPPLLSCGGVAFLSVLTDRFDVDNIIGKTVVIHSMPDDFTSQPSGNAGQKIACGVIYEV